MNLLHCMKPYQTTLLFLVTLLSASFRSTGQTKEVGPYTVSTLAPNVFRIEDSNTSNPAGNHLDSEGKPVVNNCSDMYLIVGKDKALLIDLSNFIHWDTSAISSLRSIVDGAKGGKELYITATHRHGDHLGMLPAFKDNKRVKFWVQTAEFAKDIFPADRITDIVAQPSLDLGGGYVINAFELPGHTDHSTVFFLDGKNLLFTGDGLGSGHGVWIFSYDGFLQYKASIDKLIGYIENKKNNIDSKKLLIYPGHYWQKREKENLPMQYILDMRTLIQKIGQGQAAEEPVTFNPYLNREFRYGSAIITWNKADEAKYVESLRESK